MTFEVPSLSGEQWVDVLTLGLVAALFWRMFVLEIRRTWRWERLGIALTVITACFAFAYTISLLDVFVIEELWIPPLRWAMRAALIGSALATIVVLQQDEPEGRE